MPQIACRNPEIEPGLLVQLVSEDDIPRVTRWIQTADNRSIEKYVRHSENGVGILHVAASLECQDMMICLVRRLQDCPQMSSPEFQQSVMRPAELKVLGLPLIRDFSKKTPLQIAIQDDNTRVARQLMSLVNRWQVDNDFILTRDGKGHTVIQLASAKRVDTLASIVEDVGKPKAVALLNHKGAHGWTSLHISSIKRNSEMVDYILSHFDDENEKQKFIQECDDKGWTAVDWAAARGDVEIMNTLLDKLPETAQEELCGAGAGGDKAWTVLHACAYNHSAQAMAALKRKFDADTFWRMLKCRSQNGQTVLHIAIAEGNAKAVLMILDHADSEQHTLLEMTDDNGKKLSDYAAQNTQMAQYLETTASVGSKMAVHQAIINDDVTATSWICDNSPSTFDCVNTMTNSSGCSALHVACQNDSGAVIKALLKDMDCHDVSRSIEKPTPDGDNSLHLAARLNSMSAMNMLLQKLGKDQRKLFLPLKNEQGSDISELVIDKPRMAQLIRGYRQLDDGDLEAIFMHTNYPFDRNNTSAMNNAYRHIEPANRSVPEYVCKANIGAAACIEKGDFSQAHTLIANAIVIDPNNIHTHANIGNFLMKIQGEDGIKDPILESTALVLLELSSNDRAVVTEKMEYAYWLAEASRTDADREISCKLLEACIREDIPKISKSQDLESLCRTLYMKVLIRWIKSVKIKHNSSDPSSSWIANKIESAVDQLIYLSRNPLGEFYYREMVVWLAEIQKSKIETHLQPHLRNGLKKYADQTRRSTDIEQCVHEAMDLCGQYPTDSKFKARVGYICLDMAYHKSNPAERKKWLLDALKFCCQDHSDQNWIFMNASTIAAASIHLWAMDFYERNRETVDELLSRNFYTSNTDKEVAMKAWKYLSTEYYPCEPEKDEQGLQYLNEIYQHHQDIAKRYGYRTHGLKMPRIMSLLGKPDSDILSIFHTYIDEYGVDAGVRVQALQQRGLYHISRKRPEKAKEDFITAIECGHAEPIKIARRCLQQLEMECRPKFRPVYNTLRQSASLESDRSDDWRGDADKFRNFENADHRRMQNYSRNGSYNNSSWRQQHVEYGARQQHYQSRFAPHRRREPFRQSDPGIDGNWRDRSGQ